MNSKSLSRIFAYSFLAGLAFHAARDIDWENRSINAGGYLVDTVKALEAGRKETIIGDPLPSEETERLLYHADRG